MFDYEKLKAICDSRGITMYRLGKETGIATSTLTNWGNGLYTPKYDKVSKIAKYLNIGIDEILKEE